MAEIRIQHKERHAWPWLLMALLLAALVWLVVRGAGDRVGALDDPILRTAPLAAVVAAPPAA